MDELNNTSPVTPSGATPVLPGTMADTADQPLLPAQINGITYVTGGIGDEEREQLDGIKQNFNLRIVSAGTNGEYAGNTHVVISDTHGNELLNVPAGPIFYAELAPGNYTVDALSEGQKQRRVIKISGKKSSFVHFTWH